MKCSDISVGEYVRSWNGTIGKVTRIEEGRFLYDNKELICFIASVVKHSKNIIDLIEEGDYVNGKEVIEVFGDSVLILSYIETEVDNIEQLYINQIKSIVTKEMFASAEYRVETD